MVTGGKLCIKNGMNFYESKCHLVLTSCLRVLYLNVANVIFEKHIPSRLLHSAVDFSLISLASILPMLILHNPDFPF